MIKGLIIGKFMPIHKGHMELIKFAMKNSDQLIILVSAKKNEPIDGELRYKWVKEIYNENRNIKVEYMDNNLPSNNEFKKEDVEQWCEYIKNRFSDIDIFFSSENYGEYLAEHMGIKHMKFDANRSRVPISATKIRNNPSKYYDYLPPIVKNYFQKRNK